MAHRIRDVIRETMGQRGHTMEQANAAMGLEAGAVRRFLERDLVQTGKTKTARFARYVGLPVETVRKMIICDAARIRRARKYVERAGRRAKYTTDVCVDGGESETCYGIVSITPVVRMPGCRGCLAVDDCRRKVSAGKPTPCELILEREVLETHEREVADQVDFWGVRV